MKSASVSALILGLLLVSCLSAPAPIPADATSEIYFQRAQAASDLGQYDEAIEIYRSFLAKPDRDNESVFTARYEIAFLLKKKGQSDLALADFQSLLADFGVLEKSAGAPGWVKVLTKKIEQGLKEEQAKAKK